MNYLNYQISNPTTLLTIEYITDNGIYAPLHWYTFKNVTHALSVCASTSCVSAKCVNPLTRILCNIRAYLLLYTKNKVTLRRKCGKTTNLRIWGSGPGRPRGTFSILLFLGLFFLNIRRSIIKYYKVLSRESNGNIL